MQFRLTLVTTALAVSAITACSNEVDVSQVAAEPGASAAVQRLVAEIDAMLIVPQDEYPNGSEFSSIYDVLLDAVVRQKATLRTKQVAQNMGYFIAQGHSLGWDPSEADIERLAANWAEFRPKVLKGP